MKKKIYKLELSQEEHKRIKVLAASMGLTIKALILRAIDKMDDENENRKTNS